MIACAFSTVSVEDEEGTAEMASAFSAVKDEWVGSSLDTEGTAVTVGAFSRDTEEEVCLKTGAESG